MLKASGRRAAALALTAAVVAGHAWLGERVADSRIGRGDAERTIQRIEVAFVRTLAPAAPTPVRAPPPQPTMARAAAPLPAASAPEPLRAMTPPPPLPALHVPAVALAELAPPIVGDLQLGPAVPPFDWPPSTRLSYALTGHYRGPVEGSARVEWLRRGERYQVHLDVVIGASLAPLITRQMSSEGLLGPDGLSPRRYEERTRILLRDPQASTIRFADRQVELPGGRSWPAPAGVQDAVSQFVQFTYRFTLEPALLTAGQVIEVPLALPRHVQTWIYDVQAAETLHTPAGPVEAVRVTPRRQARRGGDLVAETWYAPSLQYLPVRIVIRQDDQTFIDLLIEQLPQQAAITVPPTPPSPAAPAAPAHPASGRVP